MLWLLLPQGPHEQLEATQTTPGHTRPGCHRQQGQAGHRQMDISNNTKCSVFIKTTRRSDDVLGDTGLGTQWRGRREGSYLDGTVGLTLRLALSSVPQALSPAYPCQLR